MLIVGNHIAHLPLTSLRVVRGKSLLRVKSPQYTTPTSGTTPPGTTTTTSGNHADDDGRPRAGVWNVSKDHQDDAKWKEDEQTEDAWTTTSSPGRSQDAEPLACSIFVASNVKTNSTSVGLKQIHLTALHGQ